MYAKIENGAITAYPYTTAQLRADHPDTSFAPDGQITPADVIDLGVLPVVDIAQPVYDSLTQKLTQTLTILADQVQRGWTIESTTNEEREAMRAALIARIDGDVDAITALVIGNRGVEYTEAEAQARAYQQAGYSGTVPSMVQTWVDAKAIEGVTWTGQQAADDILATAAAWRGAVDLIRTNRLNSKALVRVAANQAQLDSAMAAWSGFVSAVRAQLGV